jgi:hypothetical protein
MPHAPAGKVMKRAAILAGTFVIIAFSAAGFVLARGGSARQPIPFSHRLHVEEIGAICTDCHVYAETGIRATIPNVEICAYCHTDPLTESPEEALVLDHVGSEEPIGWQKVLAMPDHVFFSHRRHTTVGGIECVVCHGAVEEADAALTRPLVRMTMDSCMSCHEEYEASNDCILCHR